MGDCASRPSVREIEEHRAEINTTNDSFFVTLPYIHKHTLPENNLNILQSKKRFYSKKQSDYERILKNTLPGWPLPAELNVEVQKGVNIDAASSCVNRGQPFVEAKLEPKGPTQQTELGNPFRPKWYTFFQFKVAEGDALTITLSIWKPLGGAERIGSVVLPLKELQDQRVREGWHEIHLPGRVEALPSLKLRVQLIHNYQQLYKSLKEECEQELRVIDALSEELLDED